MTARSRTATVRAARAAGDAGKWFVRSAAAHVAGRGRRGRASGTTTTTTWPAARGAFSAEGLEPRALFSAGTVNLYKGSLSLFADDSRNHTFSVALASDKKHLIATIDGKAKSVALSAVKSVKIMGSAGNDTIVVDTAVTLPVQINGYGGNDSVTAGGGGATVQGGAGNDTVVARGKSDVVNGGAGNDSLRGGAARDSLYGGAGNDALSGGAGVDRLDGGAGSNTAANVGAADVVAAAKVTSKAAAPATGGATLTSNGGSTAKPAPGKPVASKPAGGPAQSPSTAGNGSTASSGSSPAGKTAPSGKKPAAAITMVTPPTIYAGFSVSVDALSTKLGVGDPLTAHYAWDFGDASGKYDAIAGWNAAHVYAKAGVYTVKLTVTDQAGQSSTATATVAVLPASAMRTIYVSPTGDDKNAGTSAAAPVRTLGRGVALIGDDTRLLIKAGSTFRVTAVDQINVGKHQNVYVGTYGSGASPVLKYVGPSGGNFALFTDQTGSKNVAVVGLTFDSKYTKTTDKIGLRAVSPHGTGFLVQNCTFLNVDDAVNAEAQPKGLVVQDNKAPSLTGLRGYFVWAQGKDLSILGNTVVNTTREHVVRIEGATGINVSYDDFDNQSRVYSGDVKDSSKGTIVVHKGSYAYLGHDTIKDGPVGVGPLGGNDGKQDKKASFAYTVLEDSVLTDTAVHAVSGSSHTMLRDNVFHMDAGAAVVVEAPDAVIAGRIVSDVRILGNTGVNHGTMGNFLDVAGKASGIALDDNLYVAPKLAVGGFSTAPVYVDGNDLSSFSEIKSNVWPVPAKTGAWLGHESINYVFSNWADAKGYLSAAAWNALPQVGSDAFQTEAVSGTYTPAAGGAAAHGGLSVAGLFADAAGHARPATGVSVGAMQV